MPKARDHLNPAKESRRKAAGQASAPHKSAAGQAGWRIAGELQNWGSRYISGIDVKSHTKDFSTP